MMNAIPRLYTAFPVLIATIAMCTVGIAVFVLVFLERQLTAIAGDELAFIAADIAEKLTVELADRYGDMEMFSTEAVLNGHDRPAISSRLKLIKATHPFYAFLALTDHKGTIIAATDENAVNGDRRTSPWFIAAIRQNDVAIRDAEPSEEIPGAIVVSYAKSLRDQRGDVRAVLMGQVSLRFLKNIFTRTVSALQAQRTKPGLIEYQFLKHDGTVIVDSLLEEELKVNLVALRMPSVLRLPSSPPGYVEEFHPRRKVDVVTGYASTLQSQRGAILPWGVLVRRNQADIFGPTLVVLVKVAGAGALIYVPMFLTLVWAGHGLRKEWRRATEECERAAAAESTLREKNRELDAALLEAQAATSAKSAFLATISHEIRTPMNGLLAMTDFLLQTDLTPEQREYTDIVRQSGECLLAIVNDILDYSKCDAGKMEFEVLEFDLRTTVEDVLNSFVGQAESKGLELAVLIHADVPRRVQGDPGRLRQVLRNLIGNAIKFTPKGEVTVHVEHLGETPEMVTIRLAVADTGIGIRPESQAGLFTPFWQADGSTTREYGGTGLGLAICKQLIERMGGEIGVESVYGHGTTFSMTLPLRKSRQPLAAMESPPVALASKRICVVDDNATNRRILEDHCRRWGVQCTSVANGEDALAVLRQAAARNEPFDVAFLDVQMPGLDGFELARRIRADVLLGSVRLVLVTSIGMRGDAEKAREAGIEAYLIKPLRESQLHDCLLTVLAPHSSALTGHAPRRRVLVTRHSLKESSGTGTIRILVAEDNTINQKVATRMIEKLGYQADVVSNGQQAIDAVLQGGYSIVFMDCQMPLMDGFEATVRIRTEEGAARHIPIIAMTANAMTADRERCLAAGMDDYLAKPVTLREVQRILARWLPSEEKTLRPPPTDPQLSRAVDPDMMKELRELDGSGRVLMTLIDDFVEEMPGRLEALNLAITAGRSDEVKRLAHFLNGSAKSLGVWRMQKLCEDLEVLVSTGHLTGGDCLAVELETAFHEARRELIVERALAAGAGEV